jgi:nucleoside-diphosphate-sugar epimerase
MKTYLITGVNGFIGYKLAKKLLKEKYKILGIGRSSDKSDLSNFGDYHYFKSNLANDTIDFFNKYQINGVFHLASQQPSKKNIEYETYYDSNVKSTVNVINYFQGKKLDFFIYSSTISIYGKPQTQVINESTIPEPENFYSLTKYISESILKLMAKELNCKVIILRLQSVFGKNDGYGIIHTFYEMLKKNSDVELFSLGKIHRNLVIIDDVIEALCLVQSNHEKLKQFDIYNISSNNSLTTLEISQIVKDFLKSDAKIICSKKKYMFDWDVFVDNSKFKQKFKIEGSSLKNAIVKYLKEK